MMNSVVFAFFLSVVTLWSFQASGQIEPWYNIQNIEKLGISVFFDENSLTVKPYYDFHIKQFAKIVKSNPNLGIVVVHKDSAALSRLRAKRIQDFLVQNFSLSPEQIHIRSGLPAVYSVSRGENIILHIRKNFQRKFKKKPKKEEFVIQSLPPVKKKPEYIYIDKISKNKNKIFEVSLGVQKYDFSNTAENLFAWSLNLKARKKMSEFLNLSLEGGSSFSDSTLTAGLEYHLALGLESEFDFLSLNTKVYGRKNWAWIVSDSKFVTVRDLGLHLGLNFKLVARPSYSLTTGTWAEFSLSNTVSELKSANVVSFQTEITFEWFELNSFITLYRLSRRYKVFDANILGLNLGYKF